MESVALDELVTAVIGELGVPGLAVAITNPDETVQAGWFGVADVASGKPLGPDALFPIGSVSKTVCALAVLREVERGRLGLDDSVTAHLPWFQVRSAHAPITVRHLLTHTAGIVSGNEGSPSTLADVLALARTEAMAPGERFRYSNVGYSALGLVLERMTGRWIGDVLRESVLEPAGLRASVPAMTAAVRPLIPLGYAPADWRPPRRAGEPLAPAPWTESDSAAGSVCAPLEDVAALARLLLRHGAPVISEESFDAMTATPRGLAEDGWGYGCGISVYGGEGRRVVGHSGSTPGHTACVRVDLAAGLGVAVLCNADMMLSSPPGRIADAVLRVPAEDPLPLPAPLDTVVPASLASHTGLYASHSPWYPGLRIGSRDGRLVALYSVGVELELEELADGSFRAGGEDSPERIRFGPLVDGRAAWLEDGGWPYGRIAEP